MQIPTRIMIIQDGILGEGLLKDLLHINLGSGPREIMSLILPLKL